MSKHNPLWSVGDVCEYLGIGSSTLYRLLDRDPTFPPRIHLSARAVRFRGDLITAWAQRQTEPDRRPEPRVRKPIRV